MKFLFGKGTTQTRPEPDSEEPLIEEPEVTVSQRPNEIIENENQEPSPVRGENEVVQDVQSQVSWKKRFVVSTSTLSLVILGLVGVSGYLGSHYEPATTTTMPTTMTTTTITTSTARNTTTSTTTTSTSVSSTTRSTTTTADLGSSVFVLYTTSDGVKPAPFVFDLNKNKRDIAQFSFGEDTEVYRSCSLQINNTIYVYGGDKLKRQISQVIGCGLKPIDSLNFDFAMGSCAEEQGVILLCADTRTSKLPCYWSRNPTKFESSVSRIYKHYSTRMAGANGLILAFGDTKHSNAELFDLALLKWTVTKSYSKVDAIWTAPMVGRGRQIYVFGGQRRTLSKKTELSQDILAYNTYSHSWSNVGQLQTARHGHGVTLYMEYFVVVGGQGGKTSEQCEISDGSETGKVLG